MWYVKCALPPYLPVWSSSIPTRAHPGACSPFLNSCFWFLCFVFLELHSSQWKISYSCSCIGLGLLTILYLCFGFLYFILHCFQFFSVPQFVIMFLFSLLPLVVALWYFSDQLLRPAWTSGPVQCFLFAIIGIRVELIEASIIHVQVPVSSRERRTYGLYTSDKIYRQTQYCFFIVISSLLPSLLIF